MVGIAADIVPSKIWKFKFPGIFTSIGFFVDMIRSEVVKTRSANTSTKKNSNIILFMIIYLIKYFLDI